ncbi:baseplate assembly protein, partial [Escherichia coli]
DAAEKALQSWLAGQGGIGRDVALSAIMAALHVQGVQRVEVQSPINNVVISDTQAARCTSVTITRGGTDE